MEDKGVRTFPKSICPKVNPVFNLLQAINLPSIGLPRAVVSVGRILLASRPPDFEFSLFLPPDWLPIKARKYSLFCYFTYGWRRRWIHVFTKEYMWNEHKLCVLEFELGSPDLISEPLSVRSSLHFFKLVDRIQ